MLQLAIHTLEFIVCVLILALCHRLYQLNQKSLVENQLSALHRLLEQANSTIEGLNETTTSNNIDSLKLSQNFAELHLSEVRENKEILKIVEESWLNDVSSLYLIGAIDYIERQANSGIKHQSEIIQSILKSNKLAPNTQTISYLSTIAHRAFEDDNVDIVRSGAEAAKQWMSTGSVSIDLSLNERLGWWHYETITNRIERNLSLAQ